MISYLDNLKWIIPSQKESNSNITNQINIQTNNFDELNSLNSSESDSDYDYDKIISKDLNVSPVIKKTNQTLQNIQEDYNKIHLELLEKEQLVRSQVNSDTVEKIKENYTEYINDDLQIIRAYKNYEKNIKEFEDIKKNSIGQNINKQELDNKINQIDLKLENTIELINQIKSNGDEFIKKIIHLENMIKIHDVHREQILSKLEKFDNGCDEIKNNNLKVLNFFHNYQNKYLCVFSKFNYNLFCSNKYFKYIGLGIGIFSVVLFGYKYLKKN